MKGMKCDEGNARFVGLLSGRHTANAGRMISLSPSSKSIPFISLQKNVDRVLTGGRMVSAECDRSIDQAWPESARDIIMP
jgi:hypothetical protein